MFGTEELSFPFRRKVLASSTKCRNQNIHRDLKFLLVAQKSTRVERDQKLRRTTNLEKQLNPVTGGGVCHRAASISSLWSPLQGNWSMAFATSFLNQAVMVSRTRSQAGGGQRRRFPCSVVVKSIALVSGNKSNERMRTT